MFISPCCLPAGRQVHDGVVAAAVEEGGGEDEVLLTEQRAMEPQNASELQLGLLQVRGLSSGSMTVNLTMSLTELRMRTPSSAAVAVPWSCGAGLSRLSTIADPAGLTWLPFALSLYEPQG